MTEPTKKDINKVLKKVEKGAGRKESEERIIDRPLSEKEKGPGKPKNKDELILEEIQDLRKELKQYQGKTDKLEQAHNRSVTQEKTKGQGSETAGKTNEEILKEAEREQEEGEQKGQITQEEYQALSAEEKVKFWEQQAQRTSQGLSAEQALAEGNRRQQPQPGATKTGINPQYIYLLTKTIENLGPIVQTAIAKAGGEKKSGESLESLGKDYVTGLLRKAIEGQTGAGSDGTQQLQLFSNLQGQVLGNFFNTLKLLGKEPAQKMVSNIFASPSLPGFQTLPGSSEQRINP